ncbi:MAG: hypothetical protein MUE99_10280 [Chitinophagaceae bacterium]|nr:hypothetical protein [Chitinophagaceae bacterium]
MCLLMLWLAACQSASNKRSISLNDLDSVQSAYEKSMPPPPARAVLTADELIQLANCSEMDCLQSFMKNLSGDFIHARKGEYASLYRSVVKDTAGNELVMPLSTLYADVNPQATWRLLHTIHRKEHGNKLMQEFHNMGFRFADSGFFVGGSGKKARFLSDQHPDMHLYVWATFKPWRLKGLYQLVSWPCWVFEVQKK